MAAWESWAASPAGKVVRDPADDARDDHLVLASGGHHGVRLTGLPRTTPTETVPQPYRFTGTYLDPTGMYKMGARYYDPNLGRFTQPDPSGQETNPYLYAAGGPANRIDPTGLLSWSSVGHCEEKGR
nr:RHS repeat-associated core domain-containing protein [Streptomyces taklimakanensis]